MQEQSGPRVILDKSRVCHDRLGGFSAYLDMFSFAFNAVILRLSARSVRHLSRKIPQSEDHSLRVKSANLCLSSPVENLILSIWWHTSRFDMSGSASVISIIPSCEVGGVLSGPSE